MYQLISAVGKSPDLDGRYYPVDLTSLPLWKVFQTFSSVIATVRHSSETTSGYLNLHDLPYAVRSMSVTFSQWLVMNGDNVLPTTPEDPIGDFIQVRFADVWLNDFTVRPANRNYHPDVDIPVDLQTDVLISKVGVDYSYMSRRCVATVNGFLHQVDNIAEGLLIYDGGVTKEHAGQNQLGLIDFSPFGEIQTIPITDTMIYSRDDGPLKDGVWLHLPDLNLQNCTVLLSIGGYLQALDTTYKVVGYHSLFIDFSQLRWIDRFFNSKDVLDYSSLEIEPLSGDRYTIDQLTSDVAIRKLLTMSQSFLIVLNTLDVDVGFVSLNNTDLPGTYQTYFVPIAPMVMADGRIGEYRTSTEHGQYAVMTHHYVKRNYISHTGHTDDLLTVTDSAIGSNRTDLSEARFLMVTKTLLNGE